MITFAFLRRFWPEIALLILAALVAYQWRAYGARRYDEGALSVRTEYAVRDAIMQPKQAAASERVVVEYVDRMQVVYQRGATITKEIPVYVPVDSCALPPGFRVLHDAAARGEIPDPAAIANAQPAPARDVAAVVVDNYTTCQANAETLIGLQKWVREQETLFNSK